MYLHLGLETVVKENDVIGIFDLDSTTVSKHTRNFINKAEKEKKTVTVSYEFPKSLARNKHVLFIRYFYTYSDFRLLIEKIII